MIAVWGRFAAPRANGRLSISARIPSELTFLLLAAVALLAAGEHAYAAVIASVVLLNALLLTALGQWEA